MPTVSVNELLAGFLANLKKGEIMSETPKIIEDFLRGNNDAGGTIASLETAQKRAQERGAPQEVHILIGAKAEVDYIRLIENFERVSDRHSRSGSDGHKQW